VEHLIGEGWKCIGEGLWMSGGTGTPDIVLMGGMHGDERAGADVIRALVSANAPEVIGPILLGIGNPEALKLGMRNTPSGSDLNRAFGSNGGGIGYEGERAEALKKWIQGTRVLVDLHQTHCPTPPLAVIHESPAHLSFAAALGLEVAVVGVEKIYAGTMLADFVDRSGGLGVTVETGEADTAEAFQAGMDVARALFYGRDLAKPSLRVFDVDHVIRAPFSEAEFVRTLGNGSPVRAGEVLALKGDEKVFSPGNGVVLVPHEKVLKGAALAVFAHDRGEVSVQHEPDTGRVS
jgi:succinylglutamate desuccinylase